MCCTGRMVARPRALQARCRCIKRSQWFSRRARPPGNNSNRRYGGRGIRHLLPQPAGRSAYRCLRHSGAAAWFATESGAGCIYPRPESGSGCDASEGTRHTLLPCPSAPARATVLPKARLDAAAALLGRTLDIAVHALRVDRLTLRPLSRITDTDIRTCVCCLACDSGRILRTDCTAQNSRARHSARCNVCGL